MRPICRVFGEPGICVVAGKPPGRLLLRLSEEFRASITGCWNTVVEWYLAILFRPCNFCCALLLLLPTPIDPPFHVSYDPFLPLLFRFKITSFFLPMNKRLILPFV